MGVERAGGEASAVGTVMCMSVGYCSPSQAPGTETGFGQRPRHPPLLSHGTQIDRSGLLPQWAQDIPQNCLGTRCLDGACHREVGMVAPVTMMVSALVVNAPIQGQPGEGHGEHGD